MTKRKRSTSSTATHNTKAGTNHTDASAAAATSKKDQIIALLRSTTGTTIAEMMQASGWQQHSVRGFLTAVVRKKLKLRLESKKVDGARVYRIAGGSTNKAKRRAA